MKPGMSSLNPYAASYIPLSKREAKDENISSVVAMENSLKNETSCSKSPPEVQKDPKQKCPQPYESFDLNICGIEELLTGEDLKKGQQNPTDHMGKQFVDEDFEMDLAYLASIFPGVSEQSISDVYSANGGDLDASMDMLTQLEPYPVDVSKHLPDSLDIGDVSELKYSGEGSSVKLKSVKSGEASGSTSASLDSEPHLNW
ncbi:polyadenylate-binding protein-interacting protein 5-like [Malania oleifera]|uniref:polyadenylate-binding protein-interacting protein 5-like n=1 Tax=Malania oleifera TaxID=397392 RepID=UPI0025AE4AFB|nr:polyadenylate-binding protein-interacting protein 5-like [Malania oleifera]